MEISSPFKVVTVSPSIKSVERTSKPRVWYKSNFSVKSDHRVALVSARILGNHLLGDFYYSLPSVVVSKVHPKVWLKDLEAGHQKQSWVVQRL